MNKNNTSIELTLGQSALALALMPFVAAGFAVVASTVVVGIMVTVAAFQITFVKTFEFYEHLAKKIDHGLKNFGNYISKKYGRT